MVTPAPHIPGSLALTEATSVGGVGTAEGKAEGGGEPPHPPNAPEPHGLPLPRALTGWLDHVGLAGAAVKAFVRSLLHLLLREEAVTRRVQPPAGSGDPSHTPGRPTRNPKRKDTPLPPPTPGLRCSPIAVPALDEQVVLHVLLAAEGADDQAGAGRAVGVVVLPLAVEAGGSRPTLHAAHAPGGGGGRAEGSAPAPSAATPPPGAPQVPPTHHLHFQPPLGTVCSGGSRQ